MGWVFPASETEEPGAKPDPLNGARSIRELYELASPNYSGKYSVPVSYSGKYSLSISRPTAISLLFLDNRCLKLLYYLVGFCSVIGTVG